MPDGQRFDPEQFLYDLGPVLAKPHDEVDQLLHHPNAAERKLALNHPNLTEDHLIRKLDNLYRTFAHGSRAREVASELQEELLAHPAAGDRTRAYAAFASAANKRLKDKAFAAAAASIKDPAILDALIDQHNQNSEDAAGWGTHDEAAFPLLDNPNFTADHERKLVNGPNGLGEGLAKLRHPEVVNEHAQKLLEQEGPSGEALWLFGNPRLDPSFFEKFADKDSFYVDKPLWMENVAKRHPEPQKVLSRVLADDVDSDPAAVSDVVKLTSENPKLKNDSEWVQKLLSHKYALLFALEKDLGNKQQIDEVARSSKDRDALSQLVAKEHPHADNDTVRTILNRTDLPNDLHHLAARALKNHAQHRSLDDDTVLQAVKTAGRWVPTGIFENPDVFSEKVVNSIARDSKFQLHHRELAINPKLDKDSQLALAREGHREILQANPSLHPEVISELIKPNTMDMSRGLFIPSLMRNPNFNESHHEQLKAQGDFKEDSRIYHSHLAHTSNPQNIRDAFEKVKDLPQEKGEYGPGVSELRSILNNSKVELPDDILLHAAKHPNYQVAEPALRRMEQHHFDDIIDHHPDHVAKKTNDPRHLERLIDHQDERVREKVYDNSNTPVELLRAAHERIKAKATEAAQIDNGTGRNYRHAALANEAEGLQKRIALLDPDSVFKQRVGVRYNTGKLRQVRDHLEHANVPEMRLKDLPEHLASVIKASKAGINPKNGNVNLQMLQQHIDNLPATQFNVSHASWGGIQRHNHEDSKVFQLNVTTDHVNQMKQAGVYNTFRKLQDDFRRSHPVSDTAFGWVRWTGQPGINPGDGVFVDETQSDHTVPLAEKARATAIKRHKDSGGDPEVAKQLGQKEFDRVNAQYPAEHQKKINQILFGKKHSSEVLLEAFHQHLRDEGWAGTKIAIHSVHSKAPISLNAKRGPDGKVDKTTLPGHFIEGYENVPKSMGMRESTYHKDNMETQSSPSLQGVATHQDDLRKKEEAAIFQWVAMVKAEKGVHGDGIDDDFGPEVEVKLPEHAIWAEYTKRKHD